VTEPDRAASFDAVAEEYERGRPGWPEAMLDLLPLEPSATVLDLGAGTGKLTRTLAARYARVVAVEPLASMRAILQRELPAVEAHAGRAEEMPLADASVDAVFCGQSAHWFATDDAVAEIARVLRPGGVVVAAWNRADPDRPSPIPRAYEERLERVRPQLSDDDPWAAAVERGPFGRVSHGALTHEHVVTREMHLALAASVSWIASRDDRDQILDELASLLPPGEYVSPLRTDVYWAVRR
jgi:SAM-dependent methyltransferase